MKFEILKTDDGSSTLKNNLIDDTYHSVHGAINESRIVYLENGFHYTLKSFNTSINIFELGFGTGLNTLLTAIECNKLKIKVNYHAIEAFPIDLSVIQHLNYSEIMNDDSSKKIFSDIHQCKWNEWINISNYFSLIKEQNKLEDCKLESEKYHLVYYDAFGPSKQPEMWTYDMIYKVCSGITQNGVFVSYSTKGELKRMLKNLGFNIEKLHGPKGKREVLRAVKL